MGDHNEDIINPSKSSQNIGLRFGIVSISKNHEVPNVQVSASGVAIEANTMSCQRTLTLTKGFGMKNIPTTARTQKSN